MSSCQRMDRASFVHDNFKNKGGNLARFEFLALHWPCKVYHEVHIYIKRGFMIELLSTVPNNIYRF